LRHWLSPFVLQFVFDHCGPKRWITIAQPGSVLSKKKSGKVVAVSGPDNSFSGRTCARLDQGYEAVLKIAPKKKMLSHVAEDARLPEEMSHKPH
jgi:hypothetical protein